MRPFALTRATTFPRRAAIMNNSGCRALVTLLRGVSQFATAMLLISSHAQAQSAWRYQVGARSTAMLSTMKLARLGVPFSDLSAGGSNLTHASSLFLLWPRWRYGSLGIETLVGNSYGSSGSQILFQAVGLSVDYRSRGAWFTALGAQVGGMIASATYAANASGSDGDVQTGSHYKGSGVFLAPGVAIGRETGSFELRGLVRHVVHLPGTPHLNAFDATYAGISVGRKFR